VILLGTANESGPGQLAEHGEQQPAVQVEFLGDSIHKEG
jgi:hypothetical protein